MTESCQFFDLSVDVTLEVRSTAPLDARVEAEVDRIWTTRAAGTPQDIFNGTILSVTNHDRERITVEWTDFKHLTAFRADPDLFQGQWPLRPLGVTGFFFCADGLVLGRRSDALATYPGAWEPAPSGHLDRLDARAQVLDELREELGVDASRVTEAEIFGLAFDQATAVFDILFMIRSDISADVIHTEFECGGSAEYDEITVIDPQTIGDFVVVHPGRSVPTLHVPLPKLA